MTDCPNCGRQVEDGVEVCSNCGFHVRSQQADEVRGLREAGRIHAGRIGARERGDFAGAEPTERPRPRSETPAEDASAIDNPEELDAGL